MPQLIRWTAYQVEAIHPITLSSQRCSPREWPRNIPHRFHAGSCQFFFFWRLLLLQYISPPSPLHRFFTLQHLLGNSNTSDRDKTTHTSSHCSDRNLTHPFILILIPICIFFTVLTKIPIETLIRILIITSIKLHILNHNPLSSTPNITF